MKKFLLLSFLFLFSVSAFAQIRIEKRRYNKGWYVSLNHKKNSSVEKPEMKSKPATEKKMQSEPVFSSEEKTISELQPVSETRNLPETIPIEKHKKAENSILKIKPKPLAAPLVKKIKSAQLFPAKKMQPFARDSKYNRKSLYGDCDMWGLFFKILLWMLISIVVLAVICSIGQIILYSLFPVAAVDLVETYIAIGIILACIIWWFFSWLYQKFIHWWRNRDRKS